MDSGNWKEIPRPALIEGLMTYGLVPMNQEFTKAYSNEGNLKTTSKTTGKLTIKPINHKVKSELSRSSVLSAKKQGKINQNVQSQRSTQSIKKLQTIDRPKTGFTINPRQSTRYNPEKDDIPPITELLKTERKYVMGRDITSLRDDYHSILKAAPPIDENLPPLKQAELLKESVASSFLMWNKANFQVRVFSEELALLLNDLREFFQSRITKFPPIFAYYGQRIVETENKKKICEESNELLKSQLQSLKSELNDLNYRMQDLNQDLEIKTIEIEELKGMVETEEYGKESALSELNTMKMRLKKVQEERNELKTQTVELTIENDKLEGSVNEMSEKIKTLENDGDNLKPLFEASQNENQELQKRVKMLEEEIQKLAFKPDMEDVGVNTDGGIDKHSKSKKKGRKMSVDGRSSTSLFSSSSSFLQSSSSYNLAMPRESSLFSQTELGGDSINCTTINEDDKDDSYLGVFVEEISEKSKHKSKEKAKEHIKNIIKSQSKESIKEMVKKDHKEIPETPLKDKEEPKETLLNDKEEESKEEPQKEAKEESIFDDDVFGTEEEEIKESFTDKPLPKDYNIDNNTEIDSNVMVSYVHRLLPLPLVVALNATSNSALEKALNGKTSPRPYLWILRHIIDFFQSMSGVDNINIMDMDCNKILKKQMLDKSGIKNVANKMYSELLVSTNYYSHTSQAVLFFSKFVKQDYTIVDLKFFKMLLNVSFNFLYPSVSETLENFDLTPLSAQFLIHIDVANRICQAFFPHLRTGCLNDNMLRTKTKSSPHPSLVSFWLFADRMIGLFRETELRFHSQVDGIIALVGWQSLNDITKDYFFQFFTIVDPSINSTSLNKMWEKFSLSKIKKIKEDGNEGKSDYDITSEEKTIFTTFCSDYPEITTKILTLTYTEKLEIKINNLSDPLMHLMKFLRTRFTHFLKELATKLEIPIKSTLQKTLLMFRNSLVRCDISSAISSYMRYLQLLDLKLVEDNPFFVIRDNIPMSECNEIQKMLMARESLVCINLDITNEYSE